MSRSAASKRAYTVYSCTLGGLNLHAGHRAAAAGFVGSVE
jgi:hypothetical protein